LTLAASESEKSSPKVSKLPLPISDSPLVIDLPDGQKIVVGKMTLGSVIEVATWRGVGRPDSRTSRLMLGMGSGNVNEDSDNGDTSQAQGGKGAPVKPKGFAGFIFSLQRFIKNFSRINWLGTAKALFASVGSKKKRAAKPRASNSKTSVQSESASPADFKPAVTISRVSEDADIEEWLNKITQKAARETTPRKPAAKSPGSSAAKPKASVKKAAPKASNPRSTKR
jgi:hypothetical protein